jgi:hypothetical protein
MQRTASCFFAIVAPLFLAGCGHETTKPAGADQSKPSAVVDAQKPAAAESTKTVELVIDYGDGVRKMFAALPWHEKMTVRGVLDEAKAHSHGIEYMAHGSGEEAMLTKLDDLENQLGEKAKDWLYYVNDRQGDKSFDAWEVRPGDVILWKFGVYE